mmetsp:Transcript_17633/g.15551  ORF Transcript_17633/g.15551 Transcript_17633/m.15551 type:complete len:101 (+) Transcript_17633:46-348(+)
MSTISRLNPSTNNSIFDKSFDCLKIWVKERCHHSKSISSEDPCEVIKLILSNLLQCSVEELFNVYKTLYLKTKNEELVNLVNETDIEKNNTLTMDNSPKE